MTQLPLITDEFSTILTSSIKNDYSLSREEKINICDKAKVNGQSLHKYLSEFYREKFGTFEIPEGIKRDLYNFFRTRSISEDTNRQTDAICKRFLEFCDSFGLNEPMDLSSIREYAEYSCGNDNPSPHLEDFPTNLQPSTLVSYLSNIKKLFKQNDLDDSNFKEGYNEIVKELQLKDDILRKNGGKVNWRPIQKPHLSMLLGMEFSNIPKDVKEKYKINATKFLNIKVAAIRAYDGCLRKMENYRIGWDCWERILYPNSCKICKHYIIFYFTREKSRCVLGKNDNNRMISQNSMSSMNRDKSLLLFFFAYI